MALFIIRKVISIVNVTANYSGMAIRIMMIFALAHRWKKLFESLFRDEFPQRI